MRGVRRCLKIKKKKLQICGTRMRGIRRDLKIKKKKLKFARVEPRSQVPQLDY